MRIPFFFHLKNDDILPAAKLTRQTALNVKCVCEWQRRAPGTHPARRKRSRLTHFGAAALSSAYKVTSTVFVCRRAAQFLSLFTSPVITAYPLVHIYVACRLLRLHVKTDVPAESWAKVRRLSVVKHERKDKSGPFTV